MCLRLSFGRVETQKPSIYAEKYPGRQFGPGYFSIAAEEVLRPGAARARSESEGLGRQVLAVQRDHRALAAFGVGDLLHVQFEVDRADDAVAELLVDQRLEGGAVDLEHLVEAVD